MRSDKRKEMDMRYWTVQTKQVMEQVMSEGKYFPDFAYSEHTKGNEMMQELYGILLDSFNRANNVQFPGLIFTFMKSEGRYIMPIENDKEFYALIQQKQSAIKGLWNYFKKRDMVIVELEFQEDINPIYIDINDFQAIMPPVFAVPPYTREEITRIYMNLDQGIVETSIFPSGIIQAHLPYIFKEHVVNVYELFELR